MGLFVFVVALFGIGWFVPTMLLNGISKVGPRAHSHNMANEKKGNV